MELGWEKRRPNGSTPRSTIKLLDHRRLSRHRSKDMLRGAIATYRFNRPYVLAAIPVAFRTRP